MLYPVLHRLERQDRWPRRGRRRDRTPSQHYRITKEGKSQPPRSASSGKWSTMPCGYLDEGEDCMTAFADAPLKIRSRSGEATRRRHTLERGTSRSSSRICATSCRR